MLLTLHMSERILLIITKNGYKNEKKLNKSKTVFETSFRALIKFAEQAEIQLL